MCNLGLIQIHFRAKRQSGHQRGQDLFRRGRGGGRMVEQKILSEFFDGGESKASQ